MTPKPDAPHDDDPETTGHEWDGIHEFNNPLPRWWLWTFYACIVWAVGYTILYPAWPLLERATPGILGYSTRGALHADLAAFDARHAALNDRLVAMELADIADYPDVRNCRRQRLSQPAGRRLAVGRQHRRHPPDGRPWHPQRGRSRRPLVADERIRPRRHPFGRGNRTGRAACARDLGAGA